MFLYLALYSKLIIGQKMVRFREEDSFICPVKVRIQACKAIYFYRLRMKGFLQEEQQYIIKGWDDSDENIMYANICVRPPPLQSEELTQRKPETSHPKLLCKEHRKASSKGVFSPKKSLHSSLRLDKSILTKYLTRQSEKYIKEKADTLPTQDRQNYKNSQGLTHERKSVSGTIFGLKENAEAKSKIFMGKSEKKNRRKFYAKTKIFDELNYTAFDKMYPRAKVCSKFGFTKTNMELNKQLQDSQIFSSQKQSRHRKIPYPKQRTFPVFFRDFEQQQKQNEKRFYKTAVNQKGRERVQKSHFMIASPNAFTHSVEFADNNIFPANFLRN